MTDLTTVLAWFRDEDIKIKSSTVNIDNLGRVIVQGSVGLYNQRLKSLPFKFGETLDFDFGSNLTTDLTNTPDYVDGIFNLEDNPNLESFAGGPEDAGDVLVFNCPSLESLKDIPKRMMRFSIKQCNKITTWEYRYLLLVQVLEVETQNPEINRILTDGRKQGIMPSELIPEKIKQLKEMR